MIGNTITTCSTKLRIVDKIIYTNNRDIPCETHYLCIEHGTKEVRIIHPTDIISIS